MMMENMHVIAMVVVVVVVVAGGTAGETPIFTTEESEQMSRTYGIYFNENNVVMEKGSQQFVDIILFRPLIEDAVVDIRFYDQGNYLNSSNGIIKDIQSVVFVANYNKTRAQVKSIPIIATEVGQVTLVVRSTSWELNTLPNMNHTFCIVDVVHSNALRVFNTILGWSYMFCWGCSYYPQFFLNLQQWSVAGFSVDYGLLNVLAYFSYCVVMCSMYWDPLIRSIYLQEHPHTQVPVEVPDLASVIHNMTIIALLGLQCLILPRGGQRLTPISYVCSVAFVAAPVLALPIALTGNINWLTYIHVFSYIKIGISLVKYAPQAYMNWRRKSTAGYSPVNMSLDFAGSTFLVLQLVLLAANRNDIYSMIGNPAKFGVGFASWLFTGLFMVQNFILYRNRPAYETIVNAKADDDDEGISSWTEERKGRLADNYSVQ